MNENEIRFYVPSEIQEKLGCTQSKVYSLINKSIIKATKVKGRFLIPKDDFDDWYDTISNFFTVDETKDILRCGKKKMRYYSSMEDFPKLRMWGKIIVPKKWFSEWQDKHFKDGNFE